MISTVYDQKTLRLQHYQQKQAVIHIAKTQTLPSTNASIEEKNNNKQEDKERLNIFASINCLSQNGTGRIFSDGNDQLQAKYNVQNQYQLEYQKQRLLLKKRNRKNKIQVQFNNSCKLIRRHKIFQTTTFTNHTLQPQHNVSIKSIEKENTKTILTTINQNKQQQQTQIYPQIHKSQIQSYRLGTDQILQKFNDMHLGNCLKQNHNSPSNHKQELQKQCCRSNTNNNKYTMQINNQQTLSIPIQSQIFDIKKKHTQLEQVLFDVHGQYLNPAYSKIKKIKTNYIKNKLTATLEQNNDRRMSWGNQIKTKLIDPNYKAESVEHHHIHSNYHYSSCQNSKITEVQKQNSIHKFNDLQDEDDNDSGRYFDSDKQNMQTHNYVSYKNIQIGRVQKQYYAQNQNDSLNLFIDFQNSHRQEREKQQITCFKTEESENSLHTPTLQNNKKQTVANTFQLKTQKLFPIALILLAVLLFTIQSII